MPQRTDDIENLLLLEQDDLISNVGNTNNGLEDTVGQDDNDLVDQYCCQEKPVPKGLLQKCQRQNKTDFQVTGLLSQTVTFYTVPSLFCPMFLLSFRKIKKREDINIVKECRFVIHPSFFR